MTTPERAAEFERDCAKYGSPCALVGNLVELGYPVNRIAIAISVSRPTIYGWQEGAIPKRTQHRDLYVYYREIIAAKAAIEARRSEPVKLDFTRPSVNHPWRKVRKRVP